MLNSKYLGKNIWVINQFAGTPENGWGERHYFLSKTWIEVGYRVTIISGAFNHVFSNLPKIKGRLTFEQYAGRQFCWIKTPKYHGKSIFRFWSMLVFTMNSFFLPIGKLGRPDVIIVSSMPIFPVVAALYYKKRFGAKFILEIRDLWPLSLIYLQNIRPEHPAVRLIRWFERIGYKNADAIVSLLPSSDKYINSISKEPSKFNWIPNGLDNECVEEEPVPDILLKQIPSNKFIIGYAGAFNLANALSYLVAAAELLRNQPFVHFVLVGDGYQKKDLEEAAKDLPNMTFLPRVKKSQILNIIKKFSICYIGWRDLPLYDNGVSANKYFDYMLCSKPVLDSNNYIQDPVELSGCGIIVEPESPEAIAKGVIEFLNMKPEVLKEMGEAGYRYVIENNNMRHLALKYAKLFK